MNKLSLQALASKSLILVTILFGSSLIQNHVAQADFEPLDLAGDYDRVDGTIFAGDFLRLNPRSSESTGLALCIFEKMQSRGPCRLIIDRIDEPEFERNHRWRQYVTPAGQLVQELLYERYSAELKAGGMELVMRAETMASLWGSYPPRALSSEEWSFLESGKDLKIMHIVKAGGQIKTSEANYRKR